MVYHDKFHCFQSQFKQPERRTGAGGMFAGVSERAVGNSLLLVKAGFNCSLSKPLNVI